MTDKIIVGIPGTWRDQSDLITAVIKANKDQANPRYLALGPLFTDLNTKEHLGLELYDHDPRLANAFRIAGQGRISAALLQKIERHSHTAYLIAPAQSVAAARCVLRIAAFLLDAGGLAVKVETAGVAHSPERWRSLAAAPGLLALHDAFTTMV